MKRLQKTTAKRVLLCKTNGQDVPKKKKHKTNVPWVAIPPLDEGETEETIKEKMTQLRRICRLPKPDPAMVKSLMLGTYPLRRKMAIEGTESAESLVKMFPPLLQPVHVSHLLINNSTESEVLNCSMQKSLKSIFLSVTLALQVIGRY